MSFQNNQLENDNNNNYIIINDSYFKSSSKGVYINNIKNSSSKKKKISKVISKINDLKTPTSTSANRLKKSLTVTNKN
jgi:hypothetical protein